MDFLKTVGRKALLSAFSVAAPFAVASAAMFTGHMSAEQWIAFTQIHIPLVAGLYLGANVTQKIKEKDGY